MSMDRPDQGERGDQEATLTLWQQSIMPGCSSEDSIRAQDTCPSLGKIKPRFRTLEHSEESAPDFRLGRKIGAGGMGVVYTANQTAFDRDVAVKMLKADRVASAAAADALMAEAVVTGSLEHPNVVPVYDLGVDADGNLFYAMKEVQGEQWSKVMVDKRLSENLDILLRVADTVSFAHSRGILHRDLKPQNIMLGEFGEVMVLDWGASCALDAAGDREGSLCGTPAYMPPEMARGDFCRLGVESDIYLLGAMLYQIISGRPPRLEKEPVLCIARAAENQIDPAEDSELLRIALKAMSTAPADRYGDVRAFQEAVRGFRSHSESLRVQENAEANLGRARQQKDYDLFSRALFGFREALELWPENPDAEKRRLAAELDYARCAFSNTDYELALSLLDPDNPQHAELLGLIRQAIRDRDAHKRRGRQLLFTARLLTFLLLLVFILAFFLVRGEQRKTAAQHRQSLVNLIAAHYGEQNYEAAMESFWKLHAQYGMDGLGAESLLDVRVASVMNPGRGRIDSGIPDPLGFARSVQRDAVWVVGEKRLVRIGRRPDAGYTPESMVSIYDLRIGRRLPGAFTAETVELPFSVPGSSAVFEGSDGTLWAGSGSVLFRKAPDRWEPVLDVSGLEFPRLPPEYNMDREAVEQWMNDEGRGLPISGILLNRAQTHAAVALGANAVGWFDLKRRQCLGWYAVNYGTFSTLFPGSRSEAGAGLPVGGARQGGPGAALTLSPDESKLIYHPPAMNGSMVFAFSLPGFVRQEYTYDRDYPVRAVGFDAAGDKYFILGQNGILYAPDQTFVERFEPDIFRLENTSRNGNRWDPFYCLVRRFEDNDMAAGAVSHDGRRYAALSTDGVLFMGSTEKETGYHSAFQIIDREAAGLCLFEAGGAALLADDGVVHLYDMENHSVAALPFEQEIRAFGRGGAPEQLVLSTGSDVYAAEIKPDGTVEAEHLMEMENKSAALHPSGRFLAMVCGRRGRVFNLETGEEELTFQSGWSFGSNEIHFDESGRYLYYGGGWYPGMRLYETGSWSNIISITYHNSNRAHFTDVVLDFGLDNPCLLVTRGRPKKLESRSVNPETLAVSTNWIAQTESAPMAAVPFNDPETGRRMIWCKLWFQGFRLYDGETGEVSAVQDFWKRSGLGHPDSIEDDLRVVFPMDNGRVQACLKSDLYPLFDSRILDFSVDRAVLSTDASRLYMLSGGKLYSMKLPDLQ